MNIIKQILKQSNKIQLYFSLLFLLFFSTVFTFCWKLDIFIIEFLKLKNIQLFVFLVISALKQDYPICFIINYNEKCQYQLII